MLPFRRGKCWVSPWIPQAFTSCCTFSFYKSGSENMPVLTPPPEECWENEDKIRNTHGRSQQQRPYKCHIMKLGSFLLNLDSHVRGRGPRGQTVHVSGQCGFRLPLTREISVLRVTSWIEQVLKGPEGYGHGTLNTSNPV